MFNCTIYLIVMYVSILCCNGQLWGWAAVAGGIPTFWLGKRVSWVVVVLRRQELTLRYAVKASPRAVGQGKVVRSEISQLAGAGLHVQQCRKRPEVLLCARALAC